MSLRSSEGRGGNREVVWRPWGSSQAVISVAKTLERNRDAVQGYLFLSPFLAVYMVFLVFPLLKGVWISLHDWNLMAVAFNPDAKEFVGWKNYERILWGREMTWTAAANWELRTVILLIGVAVMFQVT